MLLRDAHAAGFRVPETPRRPIAADDDKTRQASQAAAALDERNARDERLTGHVESARAHAHFAKRIADAQAAGEAREGFAKGIAKELRAYKGTTELAGPTFDALQATVGESALRAESVARAHDRMLRIGQTIDTFVAAAKAAPENFASHLESAQAALTRLELPEKARALFRERLTDIPAAALAALAERAPSVATDLIKRREGPAATRYGLSQTALRLIAKQAEALRENAELQQSQADAVKGASAYADASAAIAAAERGQAPETALTAWLQLSGVIGPRGTRELRKRSAAATKTLARRKDATLVARDRLVRGDPLADAEGADGAYADLLDPDDEDNFAFVRTARILPPKLARSIVERLRSDNLDTAVSAAQIVAKLAKEDEAFVANIDPNAVRGALMIDAALNAGFPATEAVRRVRGAVDLAPGDRNRRATDFDRAANGGDIAAALERLYGASIGGIQD